MIGIYEDSFGQLLKDNLGKYSVSATHIITKCPWCDVNKKWTKKDHLFISLNKPVFICFRAGCGKSGTVQTLIKNITGSYRKGEYVDNDILKKYHHTKGISYNNSKITNNNKIFKTPILNNGMFPQKENYLNQRMQYYRYELFNIKGLVFDVKEFITLNNLTNKLSASDKKMINFLQTNFVGFLTENQSMIVFRNIDSSSDFRYYKLHLQNNEMLDYYRIATGNEKADKIVIAEGVFDIFNEYLFDYLGVRDKVYAYYSALNNRFESLIKSIAYNDNLYAPEIFILSDGNVKMSYYEKMRKKLKDVSSKITIFYNNDGDDFGDIFCSPERFVL